MSRADTLDRLEASLADLPADLRERHLVETTRIELPASVPPWTDTGLELASGDAWSTFAQGRIVLSEEAGLWNGPSFHLWGRVGGAGPLHNGTRDTASFEAGRSGALELCVYSGEWGTRDGALATPLEGYAALTGGIDVFVVRWKGPALAALEALAEALPGNALLQSERDRLRAPASPPAGWEYLWFLGPAEIYRAHAHDGAPAIRAETCDDVGILRHPVDLPLEADTRLCWRWRVDELPSEKAENSLPTHDYLSIAVEFDNGQDLTWYWSADLAPETCYRCPLPNWDQRETHIVARSGRDGLGHWQREERNVRADYERAIGEAPARIVAVWLIAVSVFQKGRGRADFAGISLASGERQIQVL